MGNRIEETMSWHRKQKPFHPIRKVGQSVGTKRSLSHMPHFVKKDALYLFCDIHLTWFPTSMSVIQSKLTAWAPSVRRVWVMYPKGYSSHPKLDVQVVRERCLSEVRLCLQWWGQPMWLMYINTSSKYYYLSPGKTCLFYILQIIMEIPEYYLFRLDNSQIFNFGQVGKMEPISKTNFHLCMNKNSF